MLVILPHWAYMGGKDGRRKVDKAELLAPYIDSKVVCFAPSYTDDDLFVLLYAANGTRVRVLSNDHYQTHVSKGIVTEEWRKKRLIKYMFVGDTFVANNLI